jgi:hypothetical protein
MRTNGKIRVLMAVDPLTLSSALSAALAADPRLAIVEVPSGAALEEVLSEADVVLATRALESSGVPVVLIGHLNDTVQVNGTVARQTLRYRGLRWLADLLVAPPGCSANGNPGSDTHFCVTPDRRTPESETGAALPITPIGSPIWGRRTPHLGGTVPPKGTAQSRGQA